MVQHLFPTVFEIAGIDLYGLRPAESEEQKQQAVEDLATKLAVSAEQAEILVNNGYLSLEGLKEVSGEELAKIEGLDEATVNAVDQALGR